MGFSHTMGLMGMALFSLVQKNKRLDNLVLTCMMEELGLEELNNSRRNEHKVSFYH
jgi:hypothetical protein